MKDIILTKRRECRECPPHFKRIKTNKPTGQGGQGGFAALIEKDTAQVIRNWCYENVHHRFFVGTWSDIDPNFNIILDYEIAGFEDASDATYFSLMLPAIIK